MLGVKRTFIRVVPASNPSHVPRPLVFAWHGFSWSASSFRDSLASFETAAADGALIVYADGLNVTLGTQTGPGWDLALQGRDVALFDALLAETAQNYCVDEARVFSLGRSFGGYFTNTLACARPGKLRAIATVIAADGLGTESCPGPVSAWMAANHDDPTVLFSDSAATRDRWLRVAGCASTSRPTTPAPCAAYDGCRGDIVFCENPTGGHSPPAYANEAMWRFFQR